MELKKEQLSYLESLTTQQGWKVYQALVKDMFDIEYNKIRKLEPEQLYYYQGLLDGIERCLNLLDETIEDNTINKEDSGQGN